jgi:type IV pilus assembly protein PilW
MARIHKQRGVSLLELMIAVAIGSFLLIGLIQIFGASRVAYQTNTGLARVQEGSRFATDFLQRDLRMAGHMGCQGDRVRRTAVGNDPTIPILDTLFVTGAQYTARNFGAAPYALRFDFPIHGYEAAGTGRGGAVNVSAPSGGWTPTLDTALAGLSPAPRAGSDILVLRIFSGDGALLTTTLSAPASGPISLPRTLQIEPARRALVEAGNYYGLAACDFAAVFQANAASVTGDFVVPASGANIGTAFTLAGGDEPVAYVANVAQLFRLDSLVYYVGQGAGGVPSLFRARFTNGAWASEEIVEGVDSMQLLYGRDRLPANRRDGAIEDYVTADQIQAGAVGHDQVLMRWNDVLAVQVGLVLRSPQPAGSPDVTTPYSVLGVEVNQNAGEAVLRRPYETSVTLRNRLLGN